MASTSSQGASYILLEMHRVLVYSLPFGVSFLVFRLKLVSEGNSPSLSDCNTRNTVGLCEFCWGQDPAPIYEGDADCDAFEEWANEKMAKKPTKVRKIKPCAISIVVGCCFHEDLHPRCFPGKTLSALSRSLAKHAHRRMSLLHQFSLAVGHSLGRVF